MEKTLLWILVSAVFGLVAGLVTVCLGRRHHRSHGTATAVGHDSKVADVEGSRSKGAMLMATVVAILAFVLAWLALAIAGRGGTAALL